MKQPEKQIRCRKCNQILIGMCNLHVCPKEFAEKIKWGTKVNTSHSRSERRNIRINFMEDNPRLFKKCDKKVMKIR